MTIPMALVDFFPVVLFLCSAILLQRDLYNKMSKGAFALLAAGTISVFAAGFFKALWKLLYAANVCDFFLLNKCFFPMQTLGFVLAAAGVLAMLFHKQGAYAAFAVAPIVAPPEYSGTMIFVVLMILGVTALCGAMSFIAVRKKKPLAVVLYALAFVFILGMGYLSSKAQSDAMNWIEEAVNTIGQALFLAGTVVLHKAGLAADKSFAK